MDYESWYQQVYLPFRQKGKERKEKFETDSSIPLKPLYTPPHLEDYPELGFPGTFPFTRGVYPTMYRGRFWTMRQYAGFSTPEETNKRFRYLIEQGQTGLSIAFDLPTQIGYDSDHPLAQGEVGKVGVAINTVEDMAELLEGIDLSKVSISMTINATAMILLAMLVILAKRQGVDPKILRGTIQNDILKEYIARGTYRFPPTPSLRLIGDTFAYCGEHLPKFNPISISGYHIREAGATAVEEVAFTLANGIEYVKTGIQAGLDVNQFGARLSFFFASHNHFFEEIAKFRAARRLWAKIMKHKFGATSEKAMMLRFHTQTGGSTLTADEPDNNVIRVTLQALAAVLGGTQSLHTNGKDEALSLPTEESALLALRTQQIIAYESGVADVVDPLGGCPLVEELTDEIERRANLLLQEIEERGGALKAIEQGYIQRKIRRSAYQKQLALERGETIVVGWNAFRSKERRRPVKIFQISEEQIQKRLEKIKQYKKNRDLAKVQKALKNLKEAAQGKENLFPFVIEALEAKATLGEISEALAEVFGEYSDTAGF